MVGGDSISISSSSREQSRMHQISSPYKQSVTTCAVGQNTAGLLLSNGVCVHMDMWQVKACMPAPRMNLSCQPHPPPLRVLGTTAWAAAGGRLAG